MSIEYLTESVRQKVGADPGLQTRIKFVVRGAGVIHVDSHTTPPAIVNEDLDAECTITVSAGDFASIMSGEMDAASAFLTGKLEVDGDMGVAMNVARII